MNIYLESISKITTISSLIFIAYQAYMAKKNYQINNDKLEREKAIELTKFYQGNIMNKISYIQYVFDKVGVQDIIKIIKYTQLKEFDYCELDDILGEQNIKKIEAKIKHNIDLKILISARKFLNEISLDEHLEGLSTINIEKILEVIDSKDEVAASKEDTSEDGIKKLGKDIEGKKAIYYYYYSKFHLEYGKTLQDALNLLEYFCMSFNSGIADEETVYQSLHQTFLAVVKVLYFNIASINKDGKNKYYTNIIKLYNKWAKRYCEQEEKENKSKRCGAYEKEPVKR